MMKNSYQFGVNAEIMVIKHYQEMGFELIKHRYKTCYGEIDIIMQSKEIIVFIEVKARMRTTNYDFLTQKQIKRCTNTALYFISGLDNGILNMIMRFDVVLVINNKIDKIYENAWLSEY